jgi:predicted dehydrogenase/putative NADH-flavin reductase
MTNSKQTALKPLRAGIIGAGYIASWHADAIRATTGVELTAVCDVSATSAAAFAQGYGIDAFTSLDDLVSANACDVVHILTPPPLHKPLAIAALDAGLDVLIEKPVALSLRETKAIVGAAKRNDRRVGASHNFLGIPSYKRLKELNVSSQLGCVTSAEINWHFPLSPLRSGPFGLWMLAEQKNLLLELGPHLFAFAVDLFGQPVIEHLSLGKPIALPGSNSRAQSWRILASVGNVDITFNISLAEVVDDRSVTLRGSGGMARLDYAADTLIVTRENTADIVVNPFLRQTSIGVQHLREGLKNGFRQAVSLNQNGPYALGFQGVVRGFYDGLKQGGQVDQRFDSTTLTSVMAAIEDTLKFLPKPEKPTTPATKRKPEPTVLVIGGTGFIGRSLTRALVASGHDVRVLSRGRTGPFDDLADRVETFSTSLKDQSGLTLAMRGIKTVFHLAKSVDSTWQDCLDNDVTVTVGLAQAAMAAGVERFIYTGTIASYDMSDAGRVITEKTGFAQDMQDRNLYARSKAECETQLLALHKSHGLPLVIARPGIVVGQSGPLQHWGIGRWHGAGAVKIWGGW